MGPTTKTGHKKATAKDDTSKQNKPKAQGVKKKRKWIPEHKLFKGSLKEGMFLNPQLLRVTMSRV